MATKYTRFTNVEVTGKLKADDLSASNVFKGGTQQARKASIATTGNSDAFLIVPADGVIVGAMHSGSALAANARRNFALNATAANLVVVKGDRLRIRAAATGTLANAVAENVYLIEFNVE
jgi:hypothetical protein